MEDRVPEEKKERAVPEADLWRRFRGEFQELADEQVIIVQTMRQGDRRLRAYCGYNSDKTPDESRLAERGLLCLLYRFESGTWQLGKGPSEDLKARFKALATRAGITIGAPDGTVALDFWLHRLCVLSLAKISSAPKIALFRYFPIAKRLNTVHEGNQEFLRRVARSLRQHLHI